MSIENITEDIYLKQPIYTGKTNITYKNKNLYYKLFKGLTPKEVKERIIKLDQLNKMGIYDIILESDLKMNGALVGYTYRLKENNYTQVDPFKGFRRDKIYTLKKIQERLSFLQSQGIIHGDLRLRNVLENKYGIIFRDIDNVYLDGSKADHISIQQQDYLRSLPVDTSLDNYMLNILTISYLNNIVESHCIEYLKKYGLPFILNNKENKEILEAMIKLDNKENIKPFIEKVKRYR